MSWTVQLVTVCSCLPPLSGTCPVCTVKTEEEEAHLLPVSLPPLVSTVSHHMWVTRLGSVNRASFGELLSDSQACLRLFPPTGGRCGAVSQPGCHCSVSICVQMSKDNFNSFTAQLHTYSCDCSCQTYNLKNRIIKKMCIYHRDVCPHPGNWWSQILPRKED